MEALLPLIDWALPLGTMLALVAMPFWSIAPKRRFEQGMRGGVESQPAIGPAACLVLSQVSPDVLIGSRDVVLRTPAAPLPAPPNGLDLCALAAWRLGPHMTHRSFLVRPAIPRIRGRDGD
jgi:hypothetical protein